MVDSVDTGTKHKDQSTCTEGYIDYIIQKKKAKVNQFDLRNEEDQHVTGSQNSRTSKQKNQTNKQVNKTTLSQVTQERNN